MALEHSSENNFNDISRLIELRQKRILAKMPAYIKVTCLFAGTAFLLTFLVELMRGILDGDSGILFSLSLGGLISFTLTLFANLIIWFFVVWSITIVPYLVYCSYQSSREVRNDIISRPLKWIRLAASTFLPIAIFSIVWSSFTGGNVQAIAKISPVEFIVVIVGTCLVTTLLYLINSFIPYKVFEFRISLISLLLYLSLFLTYGLGYSAISYSMVFGSLVYVAFWSGSDSILELLKGISTYDLEERDVRRLEEIGDRRQAIDESRYDMELERKEIEAQTESILQKIDFEEKISELERKKRLSELKREEIYATRQIDTFIIDDLNRKLKAYKQCLDVLSSEYNKRTAREIEASNQRLIGQAKELRAEDLNSSIMQVIEEINAISKGVPDILEILRAEILLTTKELAKKTKELNQTEESDSGSNVVDADVIDGSDHGWQNSEDSV